MDRCLNCNGAIGEPGVAYGYAGKWCNCPIHPTRMYQSPSKRPLRVNPIVADEDDLRRWLDATRRQEIPKGISCTVPLNGGS